MTPRPLTPAVRHNTAVIIADVLRDEIGVYRRGGDAGEFLAESAERLVSALRIVAVEYLRDESGAHLPPHRISELVCSALTRQALAPHLIPEDAAP